jgi:tetratricopeptide (TPR) repeat protein
MHSNENAFHKTLLRISSIPILFFALFANPGRCGAQDVEDLMQRAVAAQKAGNDKEAVALYTEVLRLRPRWGPAEYNLGLINALQDRYAESITLFTLALKDDPSLTNAYLFQGIALFNLGRYGDALPSLRTYCRFRPSDEQVNFFLGGTYYALGDYSNAAQHYLRQNQITPHRDDVYYYLGECYLAMAREAMKLLAREQGGTYFLWLMRGEEEAQDRNTSLAEQDMIEATKINSAAPEVYVSLGNLFLLEDDLPKARVQFEKALKCEPTDCHAIEGLGDVELAMGNGQAATANYDSAENIRRRCIEGIPPKDLGQSPDDFRSRLKLLTDESGSPEPKIFPTHQLLRLSRAASANNSDPGFGVASVTKPTQNPCSSSGEIASSFSRVKAALALASCREMNNDLVGATQALVVASHEGPLDLETAYWGFHLDMRLSQRVFSALAALAPSSYLVTEMQAEVLEVRGKDVEAEAAYKNAEAGNDHDPNPLIEYARFKCKLNQLDEAVPLLKAALGLAPYNGRANALLGEVYFMKNNFESAIPCLQIAIEADPTNEDARIHLAQSMGKLGKTSEAVTLLEAAPSDSDGRIHFVLSSFYRTLGEKENTERALAFFAERQKEIKNRRVTVKSVQ